MTVRTPTVAAFLALSVVSCTRSVQDPSSRAAATPMKQARAKGQKATKTPKVSKASRRAAEAAIASQQTGTRQTFDRMVRNGADAGEGDYRVKTWRQRLAANADDLEARMALASHYKSLGFADVALEHYRIASTRHPENAEVAVGLARTLDAVNSPTQARLGLQGFVTAHPDASAEAYTWLGILQDEAREYSAAETSHRAALRLKDSSDALHNNLGYNLLLQGKHTEAAAEFRRALAIAPNSTLARNNLAMALAAEPGQAMNELRTSADRATAHSNLAAILIERGQYDDARDQIQQALRYQKDHPAAMSNLRLLAELQGGSVSLVNGEAVWESSWHRFVRSMADMLFGAKSDPKSKQMTAGSAGRNESPVPLGAGSH